MHVMIKNIEFFFHLFIELINVFIGQVTAWVLRASKIHTPSEVCHMNKNTEAKQIRKAFPTKMAKIQNNSQNFHFVFWNIYY